tara:strand:- start:1112 stop:1741 length:630 start_codon:yes stop_codon:yes gene_type:complete
MKISYAIPVCNEIVEITRLLNFLKTRINKEDEVIILFDSNNGSETVEQYLRAKSVNPTFFQWYSYHFDGHFANMKNHLKSLCTGDWIFQIDADELPHESLITNLKEVLKLNPTTELFLVPRVNTVIGLTQTHINKWRWNVNEKDWVNWPDYQTRIIQNNPKISWASKVHEVITGFSTKGLLPMEEEWCLYHPKNIKKQERQNTFYDSLI